MSMPRRDSEGGWWRHLVREARARRVLQVAVAYVGIFFVLAQAASIFFPALQLPDWTVTFFVATGILGFPLAVGLAWAYDLTGEGLVRAPPFRRKGARAAPEPTEPPGTGVFSQEDRKEIYRVLTHAAELGERERRAFIDRELRGAPRLAREVEALLAFHDRTGPVDRLGEEVMDPLLRSAREASARKASGERSPAGPTSITEPGGRVAEHYEVLGELGRGGMGVVVRARDLKLEREVALKFLPRRVGESDEARRRFFQEARAAAALDHPNICTIHEIGETDDEGLFIAMPLYQGESLDSRLRRGPLSWQEAVDVALQVARGLGRAHEAGIVHRDVKPANLHLTEDGGVKILDFGVAKVTDATRSALGTVLGTAAYMSPEQARGESVDGRSDLWSLGVVLFEMLTGHRLFTGEDADSVVAAVRSEAPLPLGRLRGTAPTPVIRAVGRLLVRPAAERPPSGAAVIRILEDAVRAAKDEPEEDAPGDEPAIPAEGERRQATLLMVRVAGYADLLERVESAELGGRMKRLESAVAEVARRHGGVLNEFAGDRFVVLFGVPRTHEDDPLRAARAATDLHALAELGAERAGGQPLELRSGVATGTLVVRPAGEGTRSFQLAGDPPDRADRLCTEATPGETWVDAATHRTVAPWFGLEAVGARPVGKDGSPAEVARLTGPIRTATESDSGPLHGARLTPYAGRESELALLDSALREVRQGRGRFATVIGEAGIGKSRLVLEFRRRAEKGSARVVHGYCEDRTSGTPYHPFVQVLLDLLELVEAPGPGDEDAVIQGVRAVNPALEKYIPFYLHLLSVPSEAFPLPRGLEGDQLRAGMRESLIAAITIACEEVSVVLFVEDWHWADAASRELLEQLVSLLDPHPLFVIVTARPGYGADWDSSLPRIHTHLKPLEPDESRAMLQALFDVTSVPDALVETLHERSGGNPFFLEELARSMKEAGMLRVKDGRLEVAEGSDAGRLPTTVQGVIRTRLDRIPADTREVLRSAAVLGREFAYPVLEKIGLDRYTLDRSMERLSALGILQQVQVVPERRFRFRHALTQEVAYDTLLQHQRISLHERAGRAIVDLYPDRLSEEAPGLARHFSQAERWQEAVRYGLVAAKRARELSEFGRALETLDEVREWLARLPDDDWRRKKEVEVSLRAEELCETLGLRERQEEILDRLDELTAAGWDRAAQAEALRRRGDLYTLLRRFDEAREVLGSAEEAARDTGDTKLIGNVLRSFGLTAWHHGDLDEGLERIDEALELARERGDADAMIADLNNKAQILKDRGDHRAALTYLEEALELLDQAPSHARRAYTLHIMSNQHRALGNQQEALDLLKEAAEIAREHHFPIGRCFHLTAIAHIYLTQGKIDEAIATYEESVAGARAARYAEGLARSLHPLGELLAGIGRDREALPYLEEAARLFAQLGRPDTEADALEKMAEVGERVGDWGRVRDAWRACLERSGTLNDPEVRIRALEGLARAHRELGEEPGVVRSSLEEALEVAREQGDRRREAGVLNSLGILEWRQGAYRQALERYEAAADLFRELDDPIHVGLMLNSIGVTLREMGRGAEAREQLEEAIRMHRETESALLEGHALAALAEVHLEGGELDAARECFEGSLEIRRSIGDRTGEGWMLHGLARVLARTGPPESARVHLNDARRIAEEVDAAELRRACDEVPAGTPT
jgi:tetratricopeptide (TPR) repeat protein/class 3 adenylate cyclase